MKEQTRHRKTEKIKEATQQHKCVWYVGKKETTYISDKQQHTK
jgi:hypothetical protein